MKLIASIKKQAMNSLSLLLIVTGLALGMSSFEIANIKAAPRPPSCNEFPECGCYTEFVDCISGSDCVPGQYCIREGGGCYVFFMAA